MAKNPREMSVEEVLAACRQMDGEGAGGPPEREQAAKPAATETPAAAQTPAASKPAASGKSPKDMSVSEMLAAARAEKAGASKPPAEEAVPEEPAAEEAPQPAASGKKPSEMSVAEIMAAARAEKSKPAAKPSEKPPEKPKPKPAAAADRASPKTAAKTPAAPKSAGPKDTGSILAAARKSDRPGPMTKAEAAEKNTRKAASEEPAKKKKAGVPPMPERPSYARPPERQSSQQDRRGFFATLAGVFFGSSLAIGFTSLAVTHVLWLLGLARFMFPNILTEPPTKFKVGFPGDYGPGQVETKFKAQFGVWIVRHEYEGEPQIYALQSVCTHLGCTPNWLEGEQKFKCPCHGSGFYKDGINFEGPAPRPLERFAIRISDDGQLEVDKSRTFLEEKGEWKDSSSFATV